MVYSCQDNGYFKFYSYQYVKIYHNNQQRTFYEYFRKNVFGHWTQMSNKFSLKTDVFVKRFINFKFVIN